MISNKLLLLILISSFAIKFAESRAVAVKHQFHSDAIQTHWPEIKSNKSDNEGQQEDDPDFMRKTLRKFGEMASKIGNSVGSGTTIITNAIDKVCEVVKTIIPLLTAVCHVGQFKFCAATTGAPEELNQALTSGYKELQLNIPD
ncbi:unnamed protein product [Psylliodes chrysocephalus]|uniref:Uncharacterized protein n=1 Tax=Psylliodes chrysocephalus TaxID=3402493 RepID=A0A9P0GA89_9CUCU|nr:unnamed protein product [Psylliodes chrysocephala]